MQNNNLRVAHNKAIKLFTKGLSNEEIAKELKLKAYKVKNWRTSFNKLKKYNLKQQFKLDYESGKFSVSQLATKYKMPFRSLLKWKVKFFGYGSQRKKMIYKMHLAKVPTRVIAKFYDCHVFSIHRSIREMQEGQNTCKTKSQKK